MKPDLKGNKIKNQTDMKGNLSKPFFIIILTLGLTFTIAAQNIRQTNEVVTAKPVITSTNSEPLYSFRAENLEIKQALAMFARTYDLNIIPDLDITGEVTVDIRNLPLDKAMAAILDAYGYSWKIDGNFIRVKSTETKTFTIDYLRLVRNGMGINMVTLSSSGSGTSGGGGFGGGGGGFGGGGFGGGGFGGGGFGGGGMGGGGIGGGGTGSGTGGGGSAVALYQQDQIDFWKELEDQLKQMLSEKGKIAINKTAGIIQVTDKAPNVRNIESFISNLTEVIHRQVEIEAKICEVILNDQSQLGINWSNVIRRASRQFDISGATKVTSPIGGDQPKNSAITGIFTSSEKSLDAMVIIDALKEEGDIKIVSQPKVRTLNNQPALIKVGTDTPFFFRTTSYVPGGTGTTITIQEEYPTLITVGTILSITPQISTNGWIIMDISPVLSSLADSRESPQKTITAPVLDIKQSSSLVRVRDGSTVILGGLINDSTAKTVRKIPLLGDIPILGLPFRGTFQSKSKRELVIFVTPRIVEVQ